MAYDVHMFDKGVMHSPQKHRKEAQLWQKSERRQATEVDQNEEEAKKPQYGQNLNCHKMPFRLQAKA